MADISSYVRACLQSGQLAFLAILVSGGIVLQVLACALYDNWWPMPTDRFPLTKYQEVYGIRKRTEEMYYGLSITMLIELYLSKIHRYPSPRGAAIMYVLLPMPLLFFASSNSSTLFSESSNSWEDACKFLTGASAIGSIAIPAILKHAGVIGWGALGLQLSSYFIFVLAIVCFIRMNDDDDGYSTF